MLHRMVTGLLAWWFVAAVANADDAAKKYLKELQGKWQAVQLQAQGKKAPPEQVKKFSIVIKGDEITFNPDGGNRKSKFKVDPSKSPKAMDMTPLDGPRKGKTIPGIYSLEKGLLKICIPNYESDITKRPTEFKTASGDGLSLLTLAREDKAKSPDEKAIDALIADWIATHNKGDAKALSKFYGPDADVVGIDGRMVKGRNAIRTMYAKVFAQLPGNKATISLTSRRFVSPDIVIDDGTWKVTGVLPKGAPSEGRYTTIFKKRNGKWQILCDRTMVPASRTAVKQ